MMNPVKWIVAIAAIIAVAIVAVVVLDPESPIIDYIPGIERQFHAEVDYTVTIEGVGPLTTGIMTVDIDRVTLTKKVLSMSIGPFGLWPESHPAWVYVSSVKDGVIIDKVGRDTTLHTDWLQYGTSKSFTDSVALGDEGTGDYTITIKLYREDLGLVDEESRIITI